MGPSGLSYPLSDARLESPCTLRVCEPLRLALIVFYAYLKCYRYQLTWGHVQSKFLRIWCLSFSKADYARGRATRTDRPLTWPGLIVTFDRLHLTVHLQYQ